MKFTLRRSGLMMTNVRLTYYVPQELYQWIRATAGWTDAQANKWLHNKQNMAELVNDWRVLCYDPEDGDFTFAETPVEEEFLIPYEGDYPT